MQKAKWLSEEALQIVKKRREAKGKGDKGRYTHMNADYQRIARRDKKAFLSDQCKEIEENKRMGKNINLFKKIRDTKGTLQAKMGSIKGRNGKELREAKETLSQVKRQPSEWEKIANEATDKELISKVYKQLLKLISGRIIDPMKTCSKGLNRHFFKEDIQMANKCMKRCSTSLIIREIQSKTTIRYHFVSERLVVLQESTSNKCWIGWREKRTFLHCWWECKLVQPLWRTL